MDLDSAEQLSRERAVSSEPCSTRPNPFDDHAPSARKRQRVSSGGSRSRSVDAARATSASQDLSSSPESLDMARIAQPPQTPTRPATSKPLTEPTSSRVTINLRSTRPPESSPPSSPLTPSKMTDQVVDTKLSIEPPDDDIISGSAQTPSSSSRDCSPEIELVGGDGTEYGDQTPPVAIIDDDDLLLDNDPDPMLQVPYSEPGEPLPSVVRKIARFIEYDQVNDPECFFKLATWIDTFLQFSAGHENSWYQNHLDHREFWDLFPDIIWAFSKRRSFFGQFLHRSKDGRQALAELFHQFARLSARFVAMDIKILPLYIASPDNDEEPVLASRPYLHAFGWLLRKEEITHIGRNLETHYRWNWNDDICLMMNNFLVGGGSILALTTLTQHLLSLIPRFPKLIEQLTEPCRIVSRAVVDAAGALHNPEESHPQYLETYQQIIVLGYQYFTVMAPGLAYIVDKHVTCLPPDAAASHITGLTNIFCYSLTLEPVPASEVLDEHRKNNPSLPHIYSAQAISNEWKFEMLRKLIVSVQMQLRVIGVTTMCTDLLNMFTRSRKDGRDEPESNPLLLHFARLILQDKLVDYIVGIGSHPELITESYNIVGFLIATKTYSQKETDTIWRTVMTSQDPRVVDAILRMLGNIVNLHDYKALLYLCQKISELPVESFSSSMREYTSSIMRHLLERRVQFGNLQTLDAPPYELCVRLIRESSVSRPDAPAGLLDIQTFAQGKLRELMAHGPETPVRRDIYASCIDDIAKRSPTASGSIVALHCVLRSNVDSDLHVLVSEYGLTRLMIEELGANTSNSQVSSSANTPARYARREILLIIIVNEPQTLTDELGARLWSLLVGEDARSGTEREVGWQILNGACKRTQNRNVFISVCFEEHLPKLNPSCYTVGALDFAREAISLWMTSTQGDLLEETEHPTNSGLEQLWRMILKAPPNTIESPAVNMMVEIYVESLTALRMQKVRSRRAHLAFVTRCLNQLSSAAGKLKEFNDGTNSGDDEPMVIVASEEQVREQELIFTRSLILLREFLRSHQSKPNFATPKPKSPISSISGDVVGEPLEVKYQAFDGDNVGDVKSLSIGSRNNVGALFLSVKNVSGFKNCKIYHWGKEINIDDTDLHTSMEDLKIGQGLLLIQRRDGDEISDERLRVKTSTIEHEIIRHSDELWEYLGMEEKLAKEIYYFLKSFPVYGKLLTALGDDSTSSADVFPLGQPFKCLYAIYAIREHLASQLHEGMVDTATLTRAIGLIVVAINTPDVIDRCPSQEMGCYLAIHLTESLTQLLREQVPSESLSKFLDSVLFDRLLQILSAAKSNTNMPSSIQLVASTFDVILESSFHSPDFWTAFKSHPQTPHLISDLLLDDPRPQLRKIIMKQLNNRSSWAPSLSTLSTIDFAMVLWPLLDALIPRAVASPNKCEETLGLSLLIFRKLADISIGSVNVEGCLLRWGALLIDHIPQESVGHTDLIDPVARCLASLLFWCASFAKASRLSLPPNDLAVQLIDKHLFPPYTSDHTEDYIVERLPILDTGTRKLISDSIIILTRDDKNQYTQVIEQLSHLVPYSIEDDNPYAYDLSNNFDRSKSIRSSTGYVGLRNLSNTCYLNSLFTQLFMNVSFRSFMLNAHVADSSVQKLLQETQKLFSYMQNSLKKFVDPGNLAASIRTYDETSIDVSIQMDVDEFYNLLFDRWESQILSSGSKRHFRSFYGGQLVQQVKSKECPHISERLEPFSAIQCDIKGKSSLQESLQAYVDGEIMEGDNKYKCSTCDRHVNAVKRACLKDIPDNLIFHLKRFDFNLRTMQRNKINDYFSFPHKIDMRPYKVEHLMDSPEQTPEDIFELVGILVHAGTAESGHYYSYIRERPSWGPTPSWVEFNDDNVIPFDPSSIETSCFGGTDYRGPDSGSYQFDKSWSAYMLFYQRSSVLQAQQQELGANLTHPFRCQLNRGLSNYIVTENEPLVRKYCLYDDGHAPFVLRMMDNVHHINKGRCSEEHDLEGKALFAALSHLDQVVAHTKDIPDFTNYMLALNQRFHACADCSCDFLQWVSEHPEALRHILLRNPDQMVRSEIATTVILALNKVKHDLSSNTYGLYPDSSDNDDDWDREYNMKIFMRVMETLDRFWDNFHFQTRAWPEYFGLLVNVAQLGRQETAVFLDYGFLQKVLETICADHALNNLSPQLTRMLGIIHKRAKPVSFENLIGLLEVLLRAIDLRLPAYDNDKRLEVLADTGQMNLDKVEAQLIAQHWPRTNINVLTDRLLQINQNERSTMNIIAMLIQGQGPTIEIFHAIRTGVRKSVSSTLAARPFLRAALVFVECVDDYDLMVKMIENVTVVAHQLDGAEGREFLLFFVDLPNIKRDDDQIGYLKTVMDQISVWGPSLLTYCDSGVRTDTEDFLMQLFTRHAALSDSPTTQDEAANVDDIIRQLGIACLQYLMDEHIKPKMTVVKASLLSIQAIIELCKSHFDETHPQDLDHQFHDLYFNVSRDLKKFVVEEADEEVSDWDGSDDNFSSSEVMENVAELGGDINDPDTLS